MIEDEAYRNSSQYRYWSYRRETLSSLRQETNHLASERVRIAIKRARDAKRAHVDAENGQGKNDQDVLDNTTIDTLTVQEELKIVSWFASKIVEVGGAMEPPIPMEIRVSDPYNFACEGCIGIKMLTRSTVYCYSIPASVLHLELPNDLPSKTDYDVRAFPGHKV
jgi:hypothetical protein